MKNKESEGSMRPNARREKIAEKKKRPWGAGDGLRQSGGWKKSLRKGVVDGRTGKRKTAVLAFDRPRGANTQSSVLARSHAALDRK